VVLPPPFYVLKRVLCTVCIYTSLLTCLHDQNKSDFFGGPAFFQPIKAYTRPIRLLWLVG